MADGSRKANCNSKQKESSIFTASPFKLYATNMSSLDNPLKKPSNKDFTMLVIPTGKRSTSIQNGRKTVSRLMKMEKLHCRWASIMEREKSLMLVYAANLPQGTIKEIECCYDNGWYLAVTYEDGQEAKAYQPGHSVGVDLGEIHTMAAFCENGQALLITGRKVRSLHRLRNKKLAEIQCR
jgi:hypothetical protein